MLTTKSQRALAVRVASAVTAGYAPDRTEIEVLAMTVTDCHAVFQVHAPVIAACKKCIDTRGRVHADYAKIFNDELVPATKALHAFDRDNKEQTR